MDEIERMFQQMSRQLEDASRQWQQIGGSMTQQGTGAADVLDRGDEFEVVLELPGFTAEDVEVRLVDQRLSVNGERTEEASSEDAQVVRHERSQQSVSRQIQLPEPVDTEGVEATMENGLLTVRIPKASGGEQGHSIDIE